MSDTPIKPESFHAGVTVVDIGDLRVARGLTRRAKSTCRHLQLVYDNNERRVWCSDCESEVEPFDAFKGVVQQMDGHVKRLRRRESELHESELFLARSRAVKILDDVWRSKKRTPICPHCKDALLPEDFADGAQTTGKDLARKRREKMRPK